MCEAVSASMFAVQTASAVYGHGQEKKAAAARNRAKLANFNAENEAYVADTILNNTSWKDRVQQTEGTIDDIFNDAADQWMQQDLQLEEVYAKHAFNVVDILTDRYKNEYAGEQTGVTATRRAGANVREAGMALTKSVRNVVMNENKTQLNREIIANQANAKQRQQWEQVRQAPVPGHTPPPPVYEAGPGIGGLLMQVAVSAASSYMMGTKLKKMDKLLEGGKSGLTGGLPGSAERAAQFMEASPVSGDIWTQIGPGTGTWTTPSSSIFGNNAQLMAYTGPDTFGQASTGVASNFNWFT